MYQTLRCGTLVIGSGIAGLWAALRAADHGSVVIITKKEQSESNTNYAQGGIAGVMAADDDPDLHLRDTLEAGAGLCDEDAVRILVDEGPDRIRDLVDFGVRFTTVLQRTGEALALGREGGHSRRRIVFSRDLTGRVIERALLTAARLHPNVTVHENHLALDLLVADGHCYGAVALDRETRDIEAIHARATVLATGGLGQIYPHTTNPAIATGDGVAMGWRAGARVGNMEFIQFHPTTLAHPDASSFLISEAVRGEGAVLRLSDGSTFMEKYHPMGSLAPRDIVARAIDAEVKARGDQSAWLDATVIPRDALEEHFPTVLARCRELGIDPASDWIPVVPAAHYSCGGIQTDLHGATNISGLFASGETAFTGVHGANRLASNSLLEAVVFSERAVQRIRDLDGADEGVAPEPDLPAGKAEAGGLVECAGRLREAMWGRVSIVRDDGGLTEAAREVSRAHEQAEAIYQSARLTGATVELRNMAATAALIVECARRRKESRGLHYNRDHPERSRCAPTDTLLDPLEVVL